VSTVCTRKGIEESGERIVLAELQHHPDTARRDERDKTYIFKNKVTSFLRHGT
jgi:hypothetical protein